MMHNYNNPTLRTVAMPADANPAGDIFGGWLVGQMDLAGSNAATQRARGRVVTVAIDRMSFHQRVLVGDEVTCCTHVERVGRTSIVVQIIAYRRDVTEFKHHQVTSGTFTYVHVDADGRPAPVPPELPDDDPA